VVLSALLAPIMMLIQTGHVVHFVFGFDTGWDPQRRDDGSIPFKAIVRRHRSHVMMGVVSLVAGLLISPSLVAWMSPTIAGLILSIFISWASGKLSLGLALRRIGLLVTPEEQQSPPVVARANALTRDLAVAEPAVDPLALLSEDPGFRAAHEAYLPDAPRRKRGDIAPEWALAEAKLIEARTLDEVLDWLHPKERMAILLDSVLIERLVCLPRAAVRLETDLKATV
jgi:membrane glycosyltransferase